LFIGRYVSENRAVIISSAIGGHVYICMIDPVLKDSVADKRSVETGPSQASLGK